MKMVKTQAMVKDEISGLLDSEWSRITKAYEKSFYELNVAIKIGLSGNSERVQIITGLEYYPEPKTKLKAPPITVDEKQITLPIDN